MKHSTFYLPATALLSVTCFLCSIIAAASDTTLQSIAPFPFGAAINTGLLRNNPAYRAVAAREYSSLTPENVMKMASIHPAANTYNWVNGDTLVAFAQQYNKRVHGHTLVWHQSLPGWITAFSGDSAAWETLLKTHIQTVVSHYAGKLASWDVVNEAFNDNGTLRSTIWLQHLGPDYIARCFQYAHQADPDALLFYNDYGHEYSTAKLNAIDSMVRAFVRQGIPVHGVGLQMHINKNTANSALSNAVRVMAQTGLRVHISELDIAMNPEGNQSLTFTPAMSQQQADKYNFIIRLYKNLPAAQRYGITTWNISDADTWITTNYNRPDWPLPFDSLYQKKQAYQAIVEGFTSNWNYDASGGQTASGTYMPLGTNGNPITTSFAGGAITTDNDNSSVQSIGFPFVYNGTTYTQFVLNTNGYLRLGAVPPSSPTLFYPTSNGNTNSVITAPDTDMLYPYDHDLMGTGTTGYRVFTTGAPGSGVCIIEYKDVADKSAPAQYSTISFQVKLYEGSNMIEFVYGTWAAGPNASTLITAAVGIKGSYANTSVNLAKGSSNSWSGALSSANGIYFINGDYASAGPQFNTRNTVLPDAGRTYRFTTLNMVTLPVTLVRFSAVASSTGAVLNWLTGDEARVKSFDIQRAINGVDYTVIGTVTASSNGKSNYNYADESIPARDGTVYYRLKQNHPDGSSTFSPVVTVHRNNPGKGLRITSINSVTGNLEVRAQSATAGRLSLQVISAGGAVIVSKELQVAAGSNLITLAAGSMPKGVYLVRGIKDHQVSIIKVVKE